MASANTGTSGRIDLYLSEDLLDPVANTSRVNWAFYLVERVSAGSTFQATAKGASVSGLWSGSFTFDWRPGGLQSQLLASGSYIVAHNPDGSGSVSHTGHINATATTGAGGPTDVVESLTLTTLKVVPATPSAVTATRISDTQIDLAWTQANASNGAPDSTTIQKRINGGAWFDFLTLGPATSASVSAVANEKSEYQIKSSNVAGDSGWGLSNAAYTTPGAPTDAIATKASADIGIVFTPHVNYTAHTHEVWHGTITGGVTTWDGAALTTLASGVVSYTHVAPNPAQVHVYEVRAVGGGLQSSYTVSNSVQLLTAPAKPTIPTTPPFADKASIFRFSWVHNSIDTSAQTKRQTRYSTDGGATWTTAAKTANVTAYIDYAANTWAANTAVTFAVRTKGNYDSGSDGDASYSPWSDPVTVTFKTLPVATIPVPANGVNYTDATVRANVGFTQAEAATFVKAQLELKQGATLLESLESAIQVGITFATLVANGTSYTVRARVQDSNGLWSAWVSTTFPVVYLPPVPAGLVLSFLPSSGFAQIDLTIPAPGGGQSAAATVTITRAINGVTETVVADYPVSTPLTFLDTTPVTRGTNSYTVTTKSALGATTTVTGNLVTDEQRRAYLSKGPSLEQVVVFGANLAVDDSVDVASATVEAAGRTKPIGLYGVETSVQVKVQSMIIPNFGSTIKQNRDLLLVPGRACYRDSSGRRIFGQVKGSVSYKKVDRGDLSFTLTETS